MGKPHLGEGDVSTCGLTVQHAPEGRSPCGCCSKAGISCTDVPNAAPSSCGPLTDRETSDYWSEQYKFDIYSSDEVRLDYERTYRAIFDQVERIVGPVSSVFDLGCGVGNFLGLPQARAGGRSASTLIRGPWHRSELWVCRL